METYLPTVGVELGNRSYGIYIGDGLIGQAGQVLEYNSAA